MNNTMRAQVFYKPGEMRLETLPIPAPRPHEALVEVRACGICGSDVAYFTGHSPTDAPGGAGPLILGHEFTGRVVGLGEAAAQMSSLRIGDRVVANPLIPCHACRECVRGRPNLCEQLDQLGVSVHGGFAEYCAAPVENFIRLPDAVGWEDGALIEPLGCANYGIDNLDIQLGDLVAVIGSGAIGLMMAQLARARGAGRVVLVGVEDFSLKLGLELGAHDAINTLVKDSPYYRDDLVAAIRAIGGGHLADRVIVPTAAMSALGQALDVSGPGSTVVFFGLPGERDKLPLPVFDAIRKDQTIRFSWLGPGMWPLALEELTHGLVNVSALISHRYTLETLGEGLAAMADSAVEKVKGLVTL